MSVTLPFLASILLKILNEHPVVGVTADELGILRNAVMTDMMDPMLDMNGVASVASVASVEPVKSEVGQVSEVPTEVVIPKHEPPKKVKKVKKVTEVTDVPEAPQAPVEAPIVQKVTEEPAAPVAPPAPAPVAPVPAPVAPVPAPAAPVPAPVAPVPAAPVPAPVAVEAPVISQKHCLARMVQKGKVIPGTEDNKVYEAKQCIRLKAKGQLLCPKCEEYYTAYKEKSKGKANWEGFINEKPLDSLHIVGSKWFTEHYPAGLPSVTQSATSSITAPASPAVPSDPAKETVLTENVPVVEVKWAKLKLNGINYIYNTEDRRIYRADISKEGEDQIMWDDYSGRYMNGQIDAFIPEENEDA